MEEGIRGDLSYGSIPGLLDKAVSAHGHRTAIEDGASRLSYFELGIGAREVTAALMAAGIEPGDRVAIWAPNCWEWVVVALGVHGAGAALVPLNTRYKGLEAADILNRSGARLLFTVSGFLDTDYPALLKAADQPTPQLKETVIIRGDHGKALEEFLQRGRHLNPEQRWNSVTSSDACDVLFTSGTTGAPKGAICSHGQTLRAYADWSQVVGLNEEDRYLVVAPFFHCFGYKAGWLAALISGATILPQPVFDAGAVLKRIGPDQVTMLPGPPALYQTLLAHPELDQHDISSLRLAVTGAAVIPVALIQRMRDRLGFETVITGYGLTEACGIATMCRFDDDDETIATTSGRAIPGVEVRVADSQGLALPSGEPGEVLVRGYNLMQEFLDDAEATAQAIDAQGWLHTGDIGVMDERGYLRITDRLKDMYIVGGFNAYPAEIESIMLQREDLAQVAVVGVPDERLGEVGIAFVVPSGEGFVDELELKDWCREHMANFKVPRRIEVVKALPMNATGKVTKFLLRDRYLEAENGRP